MLLYQLINNLLINTDHKEKFFYIEVQLKRLKHLQSNLRHTSVQVIYENRHSLVLSKRFLHPGLKCVFIHIQIWFFWMTGIFEIIRYLF